MPRTNPRALQRPSRSFAEKYVATIQLRQPLLAMNIAADGALATREA